MSVCRDSKQPVRDYELFERMLAEVLSLQARAARLRLLLQELHVQVVDVNHLGVEPDEEDA